MGRREQTENAIVFSTRGLRVQMRADTDGGDVIVLAGEDSEDVAHLINLKRRRFRSIAKENEGEI
jgi:hypothetical protein